MNAKDANKIATEASAKKQREKECQEALTREQEKKWQASRPFRVRLEADEIIQKISQEAGKGLYRLEIRVGYPEVQKLLEADGYKVTADVRSVEIFNPQASKYAAQQYDSETYLTISWG